MTKVIVATRDTSSRPEFAGWMWVPMQYVLGFRKLGLDAYWIDRVPRVDPRKQPHSIDYLMQRFRTAMERFGLQEGYCVRYDDGTRYFGLDREEYRDLVSEAKLLVNLGGHLPPGSRLTSVPRRVYLDVDPGFTQIWATQTDIGLTRHNFFVTIGQKVGSPEFEIPTNGVDWRPILPPVHMESWPANIDDACTRFGTLADWRGSQDAIFEGDFYGSKRAEFIRFLHVPMKSGQRIELALCIGQHDHEDMGLLDGHGWRVRDPYEYAGDLQAYREFIRYSRAEFSVAKSGYVKAHSGWVSDRTACYLAAGKPALVQATGFEESITTGSGLLAFRDVDEAVDGIRTINDDYLAHCKAARRMAEEHFDSDRVLGDLLDHVAM